MDKDILYKKILNDFVQKKQTKNPAYTIGSLGRLLKIPTSRMGEILRGKVGISVKRAEEISKLLNLSEELHENFILSVKSEHARSPIEKHKAKLILQKIIDSNLKKTNAELAKLNPLEKSIYNYFILKNTPLTLSNISNFYCVEEEAIFNALTKLIDFNFIIYLDGHYLLSIFEKQETNEIKQNLNLTI